MVEHCAQVGFRPTQLSFGGVHAQHWCDHVLFFARFLHRVRDACASQPASEGEGEGEGEGDGEGEPPPPRLCLDPALHNSGDGVCVALGECSLDFHLQTNGSCNPWRPSAFALPNGTALVSLAAVHEHCVWLSTFAGPPIWIGQEADNDIVIAHVDLFPGIFGFAVVYREGRLYLVGGATGFDFEVQATITSFATDAVCALSDPRIEATLQVPRVFATVFFDDDELVVVSGNAVELTTSVERFRVTGDGVLAGPSITGAIQFSTLHAPAIDAPMASWFGQLTPTATTDDLGTNARGDVTKGPSLSLTGKTGVDTKAMWISDWGTPRSIDHLSAVVTEYVDAADLGRSGGCHICRHTFATLLLDGGVDIRHIQGMLGHENLQTTAGHTHVAMEKLVEVYERARRRPGVGRRAKNAPRGVSGRGPAGLLRTPGRRSLAAATGGGRRGGRERPSCFDGHRRAAVRSASMVRPGSARAEPSHRVPGCHVSLPAMAPAGANPGPGGWRGAFRRSRPKKRAKRAGRLRRSGHLLIARGGAPSSRADDDRERRRR